MFQAKEANCLQTKENSFRTKKVITFDKWNKRYEDRFNKTNYFYPVFKQVKCLKTNTILKLSRPLV